jgi:hypothetical protein
MKTTFHKVQALVICFPIVLLHNELTTAFINKSANQWENNWNCKSIISIWGQYFKRMAHLTLKLKND